MPKIYLPAEDSYLLSKCLKKLEKELKNKKIIEIGCGSGIQLQTLKNLKIKNILGSDINLKSVEHCKSLGFNCILSDLFKKIKEKYDVIIFNPPYLPEDKKEPKDSQINTTGGKKGSEIINEFLKQAKKHLYKEGKIILLTSSLTKGIRWGDYKKTKIAEKKLFFETLYVWTLSLNKKFF